MLCFLIVLFCIYYPHSSEKPRFKLAPLSVSIRFSNLSQNHFREDYGRPTSAFSEGAIFSYGILRFSSGPTHFLSGRYLFYHPLLQSVNHAIPPGHP